MVNKSYFIKVIAMIYSGLAEAETHFLNGVIVMGRIKPLDSILFEEI